TDGLGGALPVLLLDGEVDVRVGVGLPTLALDHPARLSTAAGIATARNGLTELAVRPLRVLLQVADAFQPLLVAQLDPAQVQHRVLHGGRDLLALAGLVALDERGEDADQQVHAGVAVTKGGAGDGRRPIPEPGGRGVAARAL